MTKSELIQKIKKIAPQALSSVNKAEVSAVEYDELTSFPALKDDEFIYLIYHTRSWIAEVSGKKYYLLNLPEMESATKAIARLLRNGSKVDDTEAADVEGSEDISTDDIEVEVSDTEEVV